MCRRSILANPLRRNHVDEVTEMIEVVNVRRVQRETVGDSDGGNEQINYSRASRLPPRAHDRRVGSAVGPCRVVIERQGIKGRLHPLQSILATGAFLDVVRRMRASGELCEGYR